MSSCSVGRPVAGRARGGSCPLAIITTCDWGTPSAEVDCTRLGQKGVVSVSAAPGFAPAPARPPKPPAPAPSLGPAPAAAPLVALAGGSAHRGANPDQLVGRACADH